MNSYIARYIQRLALCFWLGEMLFFIVVFAPTVFKVLPRDKAGILQNAIFPQYFTAGIVCAVIIIVTQFFLLRKSLKGIYWAKATVAESRGPARRFGPLVIASLCGILFAYCLTAIVPPLSELQPLMAQNMASADQVTEFQQLHTLSVSMNAIVLLALLLLLAII